MRAAVVTGAGRVEVTRVPLPAPGPGEVRVRLEGCGVCASNLGPWSGPEWMSFPTKPGDLGHEGWGTVDAVGEGVSGLLPGDRVAALFYNSYAEYDVGPASSVLKLPAAFAGVDFPGEPLACAMNIFRRSAIGPGMQVAIVGIGFLGAILTQLAAGAGAEVTAISRRAESRELGLQMGAARALPFDAGRAVEEASNLTDGRFYPVVIEATGKQEALDLAARLTGERGRLVIAGYHQDGPRTVDMQLWNWRGIDVVNAHERDASVYMRGMAEAVQAVTDGRLKLKRMITHRYPLEELGAALDATRDRPPGFLKAVVRMR